LVPLLVGTDGVQKMSKSLGNYIGIDEPPEDMFGKAMSVPDSQMLTYFEYLTDVPDAEIEDMRREMASGTVNPIGFKKRLGRELVQQFHGAAAALAAETQFEQTVQRGEVPDDIPVVRLPVADEIAGVRLSRFLVTAGLASSANEARRLIAQGAVQLDGVKVTEDSEASALKPGSVLRAGRRKFVRLESGSS
jgi:tyrosyl-tRNA synthetase